MDTNDPKKPIKLNENDSIEVNNLITLADSDITEDLLAQLENKAIEEQEKMGFDTSDFGEINAEINNSEEINDIQQPDINIPQGLPAEDGAVSITGEILERNIEDAETIATPQMSNETLDLLEEAKLNSAYKKYVIYINKENEQFIDSLSIMERKRLINAVITEQNQLSIEQRKEKKRIERTIKFAIAIVTFLVAIPIFYFIFNVCMEATIQNYRASKSNFEVLYKDTGKIKLNH